MIYVITVGYNNPAAVRVCLERFRDNTSIEGLGAITQILYECEYPLPDKNANRKAFQKIAEEMHINCVSIFNKGQDGNFNEIVRDLYPVLKPDDILVFFDPDHNPTPRTWLVDIVKLMRADGNIGFVTVHRDPSWVLENQGKEHMIAGVRYRDLTWPGGWPMGIYSGAFLTLIGKIEKTHSYYGGTEGNILNALKKSGYRGVMLCDVKDEMDASLFDPEYVAWKIEVITQAVQPSFADWLAWKHRD